MSASEVMGNSKQQNNPVNPTTPKKDGPPTKLTVSMSQEECLQFLDDHYGPTLESLIYPHKLFDCYDGAVHPLTAVRIQDYEELLRLWVLRNPGFRPYERQIFSNENAGEDLVTLFRLKNDLIRHPEGTKDVAKLSEVAKNPDLASNGFTPAVKRRVVPTIQEDKTMVNSPSGADSPAIKFPVVQSPVIEAPIFKVPATDMQTPSKAPIVKTPTTQGQSENNPAQSQHTQAATPSPIPQQKSPAEKPQPMPPVTPKPWRHVSLPYPPRGVRPIRKTPTTSPASSPTKKKRALNFAAGLAYLRTLERQLASERARSLHLSTQASASQQKAHETQRAYTLAIASASAAHNAYEKTKRDHDDLTAVLLTACTYLSKLEHSPYASEILPADHLAAIVDVANNAQHRKNIDMATLPRLAAPTLDGEIHNLNIAFGLAVMLFVVPVQWHLKLRHDAATLGELDDVVDMLVWLQYAFSVLNYVGIGPGCEVEGGVFAAGGGGMVGKLGTGGAGVWWELPALGVVVWKWVGGMEWWEGGVWFCLLGGWGWRSVILSIGVSLVVRVGFSWLLMAIYGV
ncbi:MAG: hypothetical protein L6R37_008418 [Teloschistes peruensis]|nr:MAG: hypothetical protein L6R37_008418 [Teloschistes peruensis]